MGWSNIISWLLKIEKIIIFQYKEYKILKQFEEKIFLR